MKRSDVLPSPDTRIVEGLQRYDGSEGECPAPPYCGRGWGGGVKGRSWPIHRTVTVCASVCPCKTMWGRSGRSSEAIPWELVPPHPVSPEDGERSVTRWQLAAQRGRRAALCDPSSGSLACQRSVPTAKHSRSLPALSQNAEMQFILLRTGLWNIWWHFFCWEMIAMGVDRSSPVPVTVHSYTLITVFRDTYSNKILWRAPSLLLLLIGMLCEVQSVSHFCHTSCGRNNRVSDRFAGLCGWRCVSWSFASRKDAARVFIGPWRPPEMSGTALLPTRHTCGTTPRGWWSQMSTSRFPVGQQEAPLAARSQICDSAPRPRPEWCKHWETSCQVFYCLILEFRILEIRILKLIITSSVLTITF